MHGKTVGVIGTGKIGGICAKILAGFGCKVLLSDVYHNPELVALGKLSLALLAVDSLLTFLHRHT